MCPPYFFGQHLFVCIGHAAQARVSAAGDAVYVGVNFIDQPGLPATQNAVRVASTAYTTVTLEAAARANPVKAVVYVWKNAGSGVAFVDDFAFAMVDAAAPGAPASNNLANNGGFESGLSNCVDWGNSASTAQAAAGTSAAQVGTGAGGFGQHVLGGVVLGNRYRVTAKAGVSVPGEIGHLSVMFIDAAGTALLVPNVVFRSRTYGAMQTEVIAPANATRAVVLVWKNEGSGFVMVDEVNLVQVAPGSATPPPVVDTGTAPEAVVTWRFAADRTPLGPQTRINLTTTPTNATEIMVLADGRFTILWDVGSTRYGRTFAANGLLTP